MNGEIFKYNNQSVKLRYLAQGFCCHLAVPMLCDVQCDPGTQGALVTLVQHVSCRTGLVSVELALLSNIRHSSAFYILKCLTKGCDDEVNE